MTPPKLAAQAQHQPDTDTVAGAREQPGTGGLSTNPVKPHHDDEADLRDGLADVAAGRTVDLTPEELELWEADGELPETLTKRLAALGCASRD